MSDPVALVRLLQLASPTLPVGAYSYSQGLEWQVEQRVVGDANTAQRWIGELLEHVFADGEAAVLVQLLLALRDDDVARFAEWNGWFAASRESSELRAETTQMGGALVRLLRDLGLLDEAGERHVGASEPLTYPAAFAVAARLNQLAVNDALIAYSFSWLENQVLAAVKLVPLGQVAGQRMLRALAAAIPAVAARALQRLPEDITSFAPGLALASMRHETQHTRLFRS